MGFGCVEPHTLRATTSARRMNFSWSAADIGIVGTFGGDSRLRSVAWKDYGLRRQRINLLSDRVVELLEISSGQIRPTDAAVEQRIAHERRVQRRKIKQHVSRTVSRHVPHLDRGAQRVESL